MSILFAHHQHFTSGTCYWSLGEWDAILRYIGIEHEISNASLLFTPDPRIFSEYICLLLLLLGYCFVFSGIAMQYISWEMQGPVVCSWVCLAIWWFINLYAISRLYKFACPCSLTISYLVLGSCLFPEWYWI